MRTKFNLLVIFLILVLPILFYSMFKAPTSTGLISEASDKPMVIEFSAPLCLECKKLEKAMKVVEPSFKDKITFQKISVGEMDKITEEKIEKYNVKVVPTTIFINKKGEVVNKTEGALTKEALENEFENLVNDK